MNRLLENWDYNDTTSQRFAYIGTSVPTITANGRRGTQCCEGDDEQAYGAYLVSASGATIIVGAAVQFPTASGLGKVFGIGDPTASGMENIYIQANDDGSLSAYLHSGTILAISPPNLLAFSGAYQYIEAQVTLADAGAGALEVRINTAPVIKLTNVTTWETGSVTPSLVWIYPQGRRRYDDLYVNDLAGTVNVAFEGDVRIDAHYPDADGDLSQWNRSQGSLQYQTINGHPPNDDTDYNYTSASGATDAVGIQALIPVLAGIRSVCVLTRARLSSLPPASGIMRSLLRLSGVNYPGDSYTPPSSGYEYFATIYDVSPATSSGFTDAEFDDMQAGYRKEV